MKLSDYPKGREKGKLIIAFTNVTAFNTLNKVQREVTFSMLYS